MNDNKNLKNKASDGVSVEYLYQVTITTTIVFVVYFYYYYYYYSSEREKSLE